MDNYQMMKMVELELRKHQKRIRRKQREAERGRRKARRTSRDMGGSNKQGGYRREPSLPTMSGPGHASSAAAVGLPPLSFVGLRRTSNGGGGGGPGGDSEWSGSEDVQSHFMIQRDIIPSPTTSECNFMSDDEFRGKFRFGDEDFAEDADDADEEEWERSDDDDLDDTDEETDEEDDYYEEEDDDEGTPRHSYKAGGEGILLRLSATREAGPHRSESPRGGAAAMQSDDAHMAKWRKWEQRQRAHGTRAGGSSDDRSDGSEEDELKARETMMSTLQATIQARQLKTGGETGIGRTGSGSEHRSNSPRGVVRRTRSASEKTELANSGGNPLHAASDCVPQIRVSGEWGSQWLRREGSMCDDDYDDDEDDRVMLVPEFEEDGVAGGGKIFFIPFESGSGDMPLLALRDSQTQIFVNHAPKVDQDPIQAQSEGGEEPSTDDAQEDADPHDHDPPSPTQSSPDPRTSEGLTAKGEPHSNQHTTTEARSGDGTEPMADGEGVEEEEEKEGGDGKDQSPRLPTEAREESSVQQPRAEESDETTNTKGETSSTLLPDGLLANLEPSEQVQQVVHVGIIAVHADSNGLGAAALREHARKDLEEPWASIVSPSTEAADQTTELAGNRQQQKGQNNANTPALVTAATTAVSREQRRRDKGKEKLLDADEDGHNHDHSVSVDAARSTADQRRGEVRRATVLPRPVGGATVDGGGAKKEWVWDRENVSPREGGHQRLSSSSGAAQTRSPREGATKRSPLLLRDEPPVAVAATSCLSCTLS